MSKTAVEVIVRHGELAIAADKWGSLFFREIPEEFAPVGEAVYLEDMYPVSLLDPELQKTITLTVIPKEVGIDA